MIDEMDGKARPTLLPALLRGDPDLAQDETMISETRSRRPRGMTPLDRLVTYTSAGGFVAATAALAQTSVSERAPALSVVLLLIALYAVAARLQFEFGAGAAVPTQLVLVPMLFILPVALVPPCVAVGLLLGHAPEYARGRTHPERATVLVTCAWHAFGAALVLTLAGEPDPSWAHLPILAAAIAAQFAFDFAGGSTRDRLVLGIRWLTSLREMRPVWMIDLALAPLALVVAQQSEHDPRSAVAALPLMLLLSVFARERRSRIDSALELSRAYRGTALLLGDVIEADDAYTGEHSQEVVELVLSVADALRLSPHDRRLAEFTALLHDVGKIRVPKEIINKPGPLDPHERAIIEQHTIEGEQMLTEVGGLLGDVGRLVRSCHERWDGHGYPDRLAGDAIPLVARIVCACDAFSAMTATRPYREARPLDEAIAELRRCAGSQFDPDVIAAIIHLPHPTRR